MKHIAEQLEIKFPVDDRAKDAVISDLIIALTSFIYDPCNPRTAHRAKKSIAKAKELGYS
jgi:hypothetical protein